MRIHVPDPEYHPVVLLRRAGYAPFRDPKSGEESFVRRLGTQFYPRFHMYVTKDSDELLELNLHLDMKKPSYRGSRAHSGEYSGELVEEERKRILEKLGLRA